MAKKEAKPKMWRPRLLTAVGYCSVNGAKRGVRSATRSEPPLATAGQTYEYIVVVNKLNATPSVIGCLHDRANIELAQAGLLEPRPLAQM